MRTRELHYLGGGGTSWSDVVWTGREPPPLELTAEPNDGLPGTLVTFTPVAGGQSIEALGLDMDGQRQHVHENTASAPGTNP